MLTLELSLKVFIVMVHHFMDCTSDTSLPINAFDSFAQEEAMEGFHVPKGFFEE